MLKYIHQHVSDMLKHITVVVFTVACLSPALVIAHGLKEPVYPPYCWVQPTGAELWYQCDSEEAALANCVSLMELAMKGVDPFVLDPSKNTTPEEVNRIKKMWERAKNSCWSDLKDKQEKHYH